MAPHYQAVTLIASPSYPNSIAWSTDNLVAVASGHIITILNPAVLEGPRGLVVLRPSDPFPIGVVDREDLFKSCLVPTCLSRDNEPFARSISWSQQGFAPNSGCLLAVCTVDGHVKLYRPPICEFCDEWVEVVDISQLLFNYYKSINFTEDNGPYLFPQEKMNIEHAPEVGHIDELQEESLSCRNPARRKRKPARFECYVYDEHEDNRDASKDADFSLNPCSKLKKKSLGKTVKPGHETAVINGPDGTQNIEEPLPCNGEYRSFPLITAKQYTCRNALLSSLVVAWSPALPSCDTFCLSRNWCILAVGSKSGDVSLWKICKPDYYTIDVCMVTKDPILIGVLHAHNSWVTAISWEVSSSGSLKSSLLLATGCSDGSVKIWSCSIERLIQCTNVKEVPFSFVAEISTDSAGPVSSISLSVPVQPQYEVNLAVGRVSGFLETWIYNICSNKIEKNSAFYAHDQVVTGLSWGLDGYCLYSCSEDNSTHGWIFGKNHLEKIPVHSEFPELKESLDLSEVSDRCFGLTLAPGELMIAVVRSLDPNLLNQMYQARTQKAVVEFIWIGGQFLGIPLDKCIHICSQQSAIITVTNFSWWGSNILWSLKKYENCKKALVLWDVIAALRAFKKCAPTFLEMVIRKWVSDLFSYDLQYLSIDIPYHLHYDMMSKASLRKLQLLNIICRKVMLSNHAENSSSGEQGNSMSTVFWSNLLESTERELRERLVAFTFTSVLNQSTYLLRGASIEKKWFPVGVAQMDSWVSMNNGQVHNHLKPLRSTIKDLGSRTDICEYLVEETCTYCMAPVHFDSPDVALCGGGDPASGPGERHRLPRCTASMRLCSVLQPIWHCVCCGGMVDKLLPEAFFTMAASPLDGNHDEEQLLLSAPVVPLCPLCGIVLQRSTPEFLLSVSPV